jgi:uncharacterized protein (DUF488 family)
MHTPILTIGHSSHTIEAFIELLRLHGVTALADVRSHPVSKYFPQFSKDSLTDSLRNAGISYVFLGKELGARSLNPDCYRNGKVQYELLAKEPLFQDGLKRVLQGAASYCIAMMCAEKDPLDCHRAILVSRQIYATGTPVSHILADGSLEPHQVLEHRMLEKYRIPINGDMFRSPEECIVEAYAVHGEKIAYEDERMAETDGGE